MSEIHFYGNESASRLMLPRTTYNCTRTDISQARYCIASWWRSVCLNCQDLQHRHWKCSGFLMLDLYTRNVEDGSSSSQRVAREKELCIPGGLVYG